MTFTNLIDTKKITFKGVVDGYLVCDIHWRKPQRENRLVEVNGKQVLRKVLCKYTTENAKLKLDMNNTDLLEKLTIYKKNEELRVEYFFPKGSDPYDISKYKVINVLDKVDDIERSNRQTLIKTPVPSRKEIYGKKSNRGKKNIRINELEIENSKLKLQIQELEKQIQELKSKLI